MVGDAGAASLPLDEAGKFQAYRKESVAFAERRHPPLHRQRHDARRAPDTQRLAPTRSPASPPGGIRLDNGWLVAKDFGHFKHGIETSPGSQSKTVKHAIVGQSSQSFGASSMEAGIRHGQPGEVQGRPPIPTIRMRLRRAIQRSSLKLAAHDLFGPGGNGNGRGRRCGDSISNGGNGGGSGRPCSTATGPTRRPGRHGRGRRRNRNRRGRRRMPSGQ